PNAQKQLALAQVVAAPFDPDRSQRRIGSEANPAAQQPAAAAQEVAPDEVSRRKLAIGNVELAEAGGAVGRPTDGTGESERQRAEEVVRRGHCRHQFVVAGAFAELEAREATVAAEHEGLPAGQVATHP